MHKHQKIKTITLLAVIFLAATVFSSPGLAENIPDKPDSRSVYGPTAPSAFTLYAFDPELLGGWNTPLRLYEKKFIPKKYQNLPVLGGWYGEGFIPDREVLLASGLKKAFFLGTDFHDRKKISESLEHLGMEIIHAPGGLSQTPECFRAMGRAFDRPERGQALAVYAEETLSRVRQRLGDLPEEKRPRIYFGLQADGLATICRTSARSEALELAGGRNVHQCLPGTENASIHITFEQLLTYDPEVILIYDPKLFKAIPAHHLWRRLSAVKNGRVYLVPRGPFSWLERPASFMRLIGVQWLANLLHPELYPADIPAETKTFMKLFFNLDLSAQEVEELLNS